MKTFSISAAIVASLLLGIITSSPSVNWKTVPAKIEAKKAVKHRLVSTLSDTYSGNGFHTYTATLSLPSGCSPCTWYVADVPNRLLIKDSNNNSAGFIDWMGDASYYGPWGSSIHTSNTTYFYLNSGTYTVYVDTSTDVANGGSSDAWYIYY